MTNNQDAIQLQDVNNNNLKLSFNSSSDIRSDLGSESNQFTETEPLHQNVTSQFTQTQDVKSSSLNSEHILYEIPKNPDGEDFTSKDIKLHRKKMSMRKHTKQMSRRFQQLHNILHLKGKQTRLKILDSAIKRLNELPVVND